MTGRTTRRGFPAPDMDSRVERDRHAEELVVSVVLSGWERDLLRMGLGVEGRFVLAARADGAFDLVNVRA